MSCNYLKSKNTVRFFFLHGFKGINLRELQMKGLETKIGFVKD